MSKYFLNTVDRFELKHALKLYAVGYPSSHGCSTGGIIRQMHYLNEMDQLIPFEKWLYDANSAIGSRPHGFDIDCLVEGSASTLEQLDRYATEKCDELMSLYETYIRRLNEKMDARIFPNKIPKHKGKESKCKSQAVESP